MQANTARDLRMIMIAKIRGGMTIRMIKQTNKKTTHPPQLSGERSKARKYHPCANIFAVSPLPTCGCVSPKLCINS